MERDLVRCPGAPHKWIERDFANERIDYAKIDRLAVLAMDRRDAGLCDTPDCKGQGDHDRAEEGFFCADCWKEIEG